MVLDAPINGAAFRAYAGQVLAPTIGPNDIVILDNLPAHRAAGVRDIIEAAARACAFCRPTRRTSTQSRMPSQSSRRSCERSPLAPSRIYGMPSAPPCRNSPQTNAPTTSLQQDMSQSERIPLQAGTIARRHAARQRRTRDPQPTPLAAQPS